MTLGERVIVREDATIRATSTHPLAVGAHSLIGPNAMLRGCDIADGVGRVERDGVDMDMTDVTARLADGLQRHRDDRIV
ncbi:hypothetical protein [Conexibacter arvalis]|uniref:Uncharacterized protein n=1 Tax=Conexibacter arvalis TaxID=912552 RepID=A0A840IM74_9ACTN|nr:hypothetical protein [Conexibacter arvalis]MBB4665094.1 hypothetical protein [Conexibacter arvalis]